MKRITRLIKEAKEGCECRGHDMSVFYHYANDTRAYASCKLCGRRVDVCARPMPNEIDIGGEAVALNCWGI